MKSSLFFAKILLFGEYGIIENSQGLTLPYSFYKGALGFSDLQNDLEKESNSHLERYSFFLENLEVSEDFLLDTKRLREDIKNGLFFDSNIPQGYGVGSSGALVAAIYHRYAFNKKDPSHLSREELMDLKANFGKLESYFHGTSSGIDPLICYMNLPLLIANKESVDKVYLPGEEQGKAAIFLIDSGSVGETAPMIQIFFEKMKTEGFRKTLKEEFIKYNNACIDSFLRRDFPPFFNNLKKLSVWAFEHFRPMIPTSIYRIWKNGIDSNAYYLKLCGSGGGGYILGFAQDYEKAEELLKDFRKEVIYRF
ncbi:MAG: mevalonate kinase [Bergeyella sp.]|nr:mevalonate kinase [Bergeyella sp.]